MHASQLMLPLQNKSMHYSKASRNSTISPWHCAYKISRSRPIFTAVWTTGQMRRNLPTAEPGNKPPGRARATVMTRPQQGNTKALAGPQRCYSLAQPGHNLATPWPQCKSQVRAEPCRQRQHRAGPAWQLPGHCPAWQLPGHGPGGSMAGPGHSKAQD